ncbi:hypothetical protein M4578_12705 [Salipiger sp. P9]|uniref:hypothetical protein n=1 Tax=Salipiger pentaromativorans TaxID=2943193 RepID=UPI00215830E3|nr:hypothetical protein [Salipiger pentaromativorans]MCR8548691.1 hypothetical protein [Salipiger pentaromativorans]
MLFRAAVLTGLAALALAGCTTPSAKTPNATPEEIAAVTYRHDGPPAITLYTMINNRNDAGAHSSMMINAPSQRVVFDPAGSVRAKYLVESDDVLYGITPRIEQFYERAHARKTYRVRIQRIEVSPEVAEQALRTVQGYGAVSSAQCTVATSGVLSSLPGFESIHQTWFPVKLADQLAGMPGVSERVLREEDNDDKAVAIAAFETANQPSQ